MVFNGVDVWVPAAYLGDLLEQWRSSYLPHGVGYSDVVQLFIECSCSSIRLRLQYGSCAESFYSSWNISLNYFLITSLAVTFSIHNKFLVSYRIRIMTSDKINCWFNRSLSTIIRLDLAEYNSIVLMESWYFMFCNDWIKIYKKCDSITSNKCKGKKVLILAFQTF